MTPYYSDSWLTVYGGDCRDVMRELEPESVHCVVTSPPYWGLRDYGNAGQLGLEATPEEYVASLVDVFREVRRVLRVDGTVWLNLGDTYVGAPVGSFNGGGFKARIAATGGRDLSGVATSGMLDKTKATGLKPKDLVGIPWRVAFALQADGWYLRSDVIWAKPNPMPESVTDRPTKSHEYVFLLSKSARYYYDAAAVAEPLAETSIERLSQPGIDDQEGSWRVPGKTNGPMKAVGKLTGGAYSPPGQTPSANARPTWAERKAAGAHAGGHGPGQIEGTGTQRNVHGEGLSHTLGTGGTRNLRSVWTIATQPYPGAHFATFPRKLVEPCVKAGTPEAGVCPECGWGWVRDDTVPGGWTSRCGHGGWFPDDGAIAHGFIHLPAPIPAVVLDPFAGSGTTGAVAQALGRRAILIDLNPDYLAQAMNRNRDIPLGLGAA